MTDPFAKRSGNRWQVMLVDGPCFADGLAEDLRNDTCGALIVFSGVVRNHNDNRPAVAVEYDMHEEIALNTLSRLVDEVSSAHDCWICVVHSRGKVFVGQTSVIIISASAHRREAYVASEEVIDRLKKEVPIWKKEIRPDNTVSWLDGTSIRSD